MNSVIKNPEFKQVITKIIIIQIAFAVAVFIFTGYEFSTFNKSVINQNTALIGKILAEYPDVEDEIGGIISKGVSDDEYLKGANFLKQYGYDENIPIDSNPILSTFYNYFALKMVLFCLLLIIPLLFLLYFEYGKIYSKVRRISGASEKVVDGDFNIILPEDREGDFGLLSYHFNQMASRLKISLNSLKEDKVFLKNIISDISHQLKTPLSSLIMFNELILSNKKMDYRTRNEFLQKSKDQLDRMEWLIINLLKMARLEAGAINFQKVSVRMIDVVNMAVSSLENLSKSKKQTINIIEENKEVQFIGDKEWTCEALINIVKNCIEHTGVNGRISITLSETPIFSRVTIKDSGEGIDEKDIPRIFERFYRGSNSVNTQSAGIGLALTNLIVEGQGGSITVSSEKGVGSEFTVTFLKGII